MPELSVILPARNAEETIARAVSSTLAAMPRDSQLLVADDGSADSTAERALEGATRHGVRDPRLRVLAAKPGQGGVSRVLNQLLDASDSRFVGRMDADDISMPGRFSAALRAIDRGDDFVFTQIIEVGGSAVRPRAPYSITPQEMPWHLLLTNPVCHPTMVATRQVLDDLGGYRSVPAEDYDLWIRAATRGAALRRLRRWGLLYRVHPTQVTASPVWRSRSWTDEDQAAAYGDLAELLTGVRLNRLVCLAGLPRVRQEEEIGMFCAAVTPGIDALGGVSSALLKNRLRRRIAWVRANHQDIR